jgi:hypothetical protein
VSLQDAAQAAVATFPDVPIRTPAGTFPLPVVMVAIAGAESGWDDAAQGDYGLGGPSCHGYTSWGLWQIHNVHAAYLEQVTGSSDPCVWAAWLYDPYHNAQAALVLLDDDPQAGLSNWTTWNNGTYLQYLGQAQQAVAAVAAQGGGAPTSMQIIERVAVPLGFGLLFLVGLGAIALGVAEETGWLPREIEVLRRAIRRRLGAGY